MTSTAKAKTTPSSGSWNAPRSARPVNTSPAAGCPWSTAAGFQIEETERLKAGTVERIHAVKPARSAVWGHAQPPSGRDGRGRR
jgi:hypothetical protein